MIKICDGKPNDGIVRMLIDQLQKSSPRLSSDSDHRVSAKQSCITPVTLKGLAFRWSSWSWRKQGSEPWQFGKSWIRTALTSFTALRKIRHHESGWSLIRSEHADPCSSRLL